MTTEEDTLNIIINRKDIEGLDNLRDIFAAILEGGVGVTVEYYLDLQEEEG